MCAATNWRLFTYHFSYKLRRLDNLTCEWAVESSKICDCNLQTSIMNCWGFFKTCEEWRDASKCFHTLPEIFVTSQPLTLNPFYPWHVLCLTPWGTVKLPFPISSYARCFTLYFCMFSLSSESTLIPCSANNNVRHSFTKILSPSILLSFLSSTGI